MAKLLSLINGPRLMACSFEMKKMAPVDERPTQIECEITSAVKIDKKPEVFVKVSASSNSTALPFNFNVTMDAKFMLNENSISPETDIVQAITEEGSPIIYTVLREMVADLTRKANVPPFYLPEIGFNDFDLKKIKAKRPPRKTKKT